MTATIFDHQERRQWRDRASAYADSFAHLCGHTASALLDAVAVKPGERLLDAGTGTGTVAALAAARGAEVTAVDAEPSMVAYARERVPAANIVEAILPSLPFEDDAFDAVVANFVLNHVGDPRAAVAELRRVTRTGGRIAVTIWPYPQPPLQRLWADAVEVPGLVRPADRVALPADLDFPRTPDGFAALLSDAGFAEVGCETVEWDHVVDAEDWWSGPANGIASIGQLVVAQTPAVVDRIHARYLELAAAFRRADGLLALPTSALLATGTA
ncbi:methyltransferase domain-containing protein [Hamadaea sp.]|uniref:class I SAM-dependent methyltransferase n=1 Tax=Hamadaea sp. TaxID=2024425 RepID=UPI0025C1DFFE|nr:methyltransferase domain-containing protein [Hamadaea sp.]